MKGVGILCGCVFMHAYKLMRVCMSLAHHVHTCMCCLQCACIRSCVYVCVQTRAHVQHTADMRLCECECVLSCFFWVLFCACWSVLSCFLCRTKEGCSSTLTCIHTWNNMIHVNFMRD